MGVVSAGPVTGAVAVALAAGCYAPDVRDCVVACAGPDDCVAGQVCGSDGLCASAGVAGRCDEATAPDARDVSPPIDAPPPPPIDAPPPPPDAVVAVIRIEITGRGRVQLRGSLDEECRAMTSLGASCEYPAPAGMIVELRPKEEHDWVFAGWDHPACNGVWACLFLVGPGTTTVGAAFVSED
jgi:hypothetical protein